MKIGAKVGAIVCLSIAATVSSLFVMSENSYAQKLGQMYMRGQYAHMDNDRADDSFTLLDPDHDRNGWGCSTGVCILAVPKDPWLGQEVWGEVGLEYNRFAKSNTSTLTVFGLPNEKVPQSIFNVYLGPKYRFNNLGRFHPFFGVAMMFGVISPPSDAVTYLDIGVQPSAGFDYVLPPYGGLLSLGVDYRHHFFLGELDNDINFGSTGVFLAVNF